MNEHLYRTTVDALDRLAKLVIASEAGDDAVARIARRKAVALSRDSIDWVRGLPDGAEVIPFPAKPNHPEPPPSAA